MKLSKNGLQLIKKFEGLRLSAYQDVAGIWTIGYGSTCYTDGKPVKCGDKLTNELQAAMLLLHTLAQYEDAVNKYAKIQLTQNQFDALVSFTYNEGSGALKASTLLKKLNAGNCAEAANQLLLWDKITDPLNGRKTTNQTLTERRKAERNLFLSEIITSQLIPKT